MFLKKETYLELKGKDLKSSPEKIVGIIDKKKEIKKIALDDFNSGLTEEETKCSLISSGVM